MLAQSRLYPKVSLPTLRLDGHMLQSGTGLEDENTGKCKLVNIAVNAM